MRRLSLRSGEAAVLAQALALWAVDVCVYTAQEVRRSCRQRQRLGSFIGSQAGAMHCCSQCRLVFRAVHIDRCAHGLMRLNQLPEGGRISYVVLERDGGGVLCRNQNNNSDSNAQNFIPHKDWPKTCPLQEEKSAFDIVQSNQYEAGGGCT